MTGEDHFSDFDESVTSQPISSSNSSGGGQSSGSFNGSGGGQNRRSGSGHYANEIFSKKISARMRTFFIDVKQSSNGKFIKISEKSRGGQKSTIMMDAEDLSEFIAALQEAQQAL